MNTTSKIDDAISRLTDSYVNHGGVNDRRRLNLPSREGIVGIVKTVESIMFPGFYRDEPMLPGELERLAGIRTVELYRKLSSETSKDIAFQLRIRDDERVVSMSKCMHGDTLAEEIIELLPDIRAKILLDKDALLVGDPASGSGEEVILAYPGLRAMIVHRFAHELWMRGARLVARMMTEYIHSRTGIDIHPGARIGSSFFIDHGTGVVVGETTVIGNNVKLYQGVTLGALSVSTEQRGRKRHPTIEDSVTVYAGATILGGETIIGHDSVVGGNVWLVRSVPPYSRVETSPAVKVIPKSSRTLQWSYSI